VKAQEYFKTFHGALKENQFTRPIIGALIASNLLVSIIAFGRNETVVMVPPGLDERVEIGVSEGSPGLKEAWGTHIAMLMGNATPRTATYLSEQLGRLSSPRLFQQIQEQIDKQAKALTDEGMSVSFVPNATFYLPSRDVVIVSGEYMLRGMRGMERSMVRTYEIGVRIQDYRVRMDSFDVYEGPWNERIEAERAATQATGSAPAATR
jgi:conjugal transfer pilus assembly protein TraE